MRCYQLCLLVSLHTLDGSSNGTLTGSLVARADDTHRRLSVDFMEVAKLTASDAIYEDYRGGYFSEFGYFVAIDGGTLVVGAPKDPGGGAVYAFRTTDGGATYVEVAKLTVDAGCGFGYSVRS